MRPLALLLGLASVALATTVLDPNYSFICFAAIGGHGTGSMGEQLVRRISYPVRDDIVGSHCPPPLPPQVSWSLLRFKQAWYILSIAWGAQLIACVVPCLQFRD